MKRVRPVDDGEHVPKLHPNDIRRYMLKPQNADTAYIPSLLWEILVDGVMAALGRLDFPTFLAMAISCKTIYAKSNWQRHAERINGAERYWKPKYFEQFAPYVVEFDYALPCHHGRVMVNLASCPRLTTLSLYGHECYTGTWMDSFANVEGFFPPTLTHLTLHNYGTDEISSRAFAAIPFGQLRVAVCSGPCVWKDVLFTRADGKPYAGFQRSRCKCLPPGRIPYD
jgi:hypothetical protein